MVVAASLGGDDEISSMENGEFALFMTVLVVLGGMGAVMVVRLWYNALNFRQASSVIDEFNLSSDDADMRRLVENHKIFESSSARILLPRGA